MKAVLPFFLTFISVVFSCGCRGGGASELRSGGDTLTAESELLTMVDYGDYVVADVVNPWTGELFERYVLVSDNYSGTVPEGIIINVPLKRSIVYSGVHTGAVEELGQLDAVKGVADGKYFSSPEMKNRISDGRVRDIGNAQSPSMEAVVDMEPDAILLSPYQNQEAGAVASLGVPLIQMVDYMEPTPLGRAEWIRFIGRLYGEASKSDSIYLAVAAEYKRLRGEAEKSTVRPTVITELPQPGGVWYVPSGESYMARMIADAGGVYPWAGTKGSGSLTLDAAEALDKGRDADIWLIRNFGALTLKNIAESNPLASHFRAFDAGGVYVCDTSVSTLFDEFPFHPERLLAEYIKIFRSGVAETEDGKLRYFNRISE